MFDYKESVERLKEEIRNMIEAMYFLNKFQNFENGKENLEKIKEMAKIFGFEINEIDNIGNENVHKYLTHISKANKLDWYTLNFLRDYQTSLAENLEDKIKENIRYAEELVRIGDIIRSRNMNNDQDKWKYFYFSALRAYLKSNKIDEALDLIKTRL
ncbi:MAG: hypothetical protein N3D78_03060 [Candidatus Aenigmarchaeota archaeon]|nr:hypothetical protein [Candidatus Aenigmarchaeota archaeon]